MWSQTKRSQMSWSQMNVVSNEQVSNELVSIVCTPNLSTLTTQALHFICSLFLHFIYLFSILSHAFTLYNRFCAFLCRFYSIYCVAIFHHLPAFFISHFYVFSVTCCHPFPITWCSVCVFVFIRHTAHCFLLLVSCMLYVVKNIALRKPTWIGGRNVGY